MNTRFLLLTVILLLVGATIILTPEQAEAQSRRGLRAEVHDGDVHYKWSNGHDLLEVRLKGDMAFTADDRAVESMSRDGFLKIEERKDGARRTLEVRPTSGGTLRYTYKVNGTQRAYDDATRDEVAELILIAIRNTGIGADQRVARSSSKTEMKSSHTVASPSTPCGATSSSMSTWLNRRASAHFSRRSKS